MQHLQPLIGEWELEIPLADATVRGRTTFERLGDGFVVMRTTVEAPEFPDSVSLIGGEPLAMHHFDARGVRRVYGASLEGGVLRFWRDGQRYAATLSADAATLDGAWQRSADGAAWEHDFDLRYTRIS